MREKAFSLIELLLALGVVSLLGALIVPKYLSVNTQAQAVVAAQIASQLNSTYGQWAASGGIAGSAALTADVLQVLTSNRKTSAGSGTGLVQDSDQSQYIRLPTSPDLQASMDAAIARRPVTSEMVIYNGVPVAFGVPPSGDTAQFCAIPAYSLTTPYNAEPLSLSELPLFMSAWGAQRGDPRYIARYDANNDGKTNSIDRSYFLGHAK